MESKSKKPNTYGYRYNVNDPETNDLYRRFKAWKGIPLHEPIADVERNEFERWVDVYLERRKSDV